MRKTPVLFAATLLIAACSTETPDVIDTEGPELSPIDEPQPGTIHGPTWDSSTLTYHCEGDVELQVSYLNIDDGPSFAAMLHDGRLSMLQHRVIASGAQYIALDEQHSLRWHTKGEEARLSFREADHTAEEEELLSDCRVSQ